MGFGAVTAPFKQKYTAHTELKDPLFTCNRYMLLRFLLTSLIIGVSTPAAIAGGYEDLMQQTQAGMSAYIPTPKPVATVQMLAPQATPTVQASYSRPSAPITHATQPLSAPLLSGTRLNASMHGIRKSGNQLIVSYTFESATPLAQIKNSPSKPRTLNNAERNIVREVLERELPSKIPVQFELTMDVEKAYMRVMADDLAQGGSRLQSRMLGYATSPHPAGAQLVLDGQVCHPTKSDCDLLKGTARHEVGHILGLRHPEDAGTQWARFPSIMHATSTKYIEYQPQDIASLQQLYGTRNGTLPIALETTPSNTSETVVAADTDTKNGLLGMLQQWMP